MSDLEESSKAVAEIAKFGTVSVEATERLCSFFAKVLGEPFQDAVGLLSDKLKLFRFENQIAIMDKVNKILDEKGVDRTKPIPPKFAIPLMEYASLEDNEILQNIWCNLLANSLDSTCDFEFKYFYIEIIRNLTPLDVLVMKFIYDSEIKAADTKFIETKKPVSLHEFPVSFDKIMNYASTKQAYNVRISICNLMRVQCIEETSLVERFRASNSGNRFRPRLDETYVLTTLGFHFTQTCMR